MGAQARGWPYRSHATYATSERWISHGSASPRHVASGPPRKAETLDRDPESGGTTGEFKHIDKAEEKKLTRIPTDDDGREEPKRESRRPAVECNTGERPRAGRARKSLEGRRRR